ncbi:hypothetical protein V8G56_10880 [Gaetbulibacter aquiaggeris]|uniref:DUF1574 domain-containing protein n=1 Tax=Gaetbulibacter aquiaggeris TaxID=1735373 RepID=A0ABW7MVR3_9FLAO
MKSELTLSIRQILKFIIIFLIVDFLFGSISKKIFYEQKTGKFYRSTYAIKEAKEDILIFGSSHAHRHYVPEVMEKELLKTCYNVGAEGQQLLFHAAFQKMILKRRVPELIVLNIDENFLYKSNAAYNRLSDLHPYYSEFKNELRSFLSLNSSFMDFKLFFKSYQTNSTLIHAIRYYISPQIDYKGYRPLDGVMTLNKVAFYEKDNSEKEYIQEIDPVFVAAFKDFILTAKKNNIKLVFVTSPNLIERSISENESFKMIKVISKLEKIPFFDFLNSPAYINQYDLFHDPSHLNDNGARIFTKSVAELINVID